MPRFRIDAGDQPVGRHPTSDPPSPVLTSDQVLAHHTGQQQRGLTDPFVQVTASSNENLNRIVRECLPKGTEITSDPHHLAAIAAEINDRPVRFTPRENPARYSPNSSKQMLPPPELADRKAAKFSAIEYQNAQVIPTHQPTKRLMIFASIGSDQCDLPQGVDHAVHCRMRGRVGRGGGVHGADQACIGQRSGKQAGRDVAQR